MTTMTREEQVARIERALALWGSRKATAAQVEALRGKLMRILENGKLPEKKSALWNYLCLSMQSAEMDEHRKEVRREKAARMKEANALVSVVQEFERELARVRKLAACREASLMLHEHREREGAHAMSVAFRRKLEGAPLSPYVPIDTQHQWVCRGVKLFAKLGASAELMEHLRTRL